MDKMDKFKDFIYNVSDVLVTILIILIAALLISWRVSAIVHYPDKVHSEQGNYSSVVQDDEDEDKDDRENQDNDKKSGKDSDDNDNDKDTDDSDDKTDTTAKSYSITVTDNESAGEIAQNLVDIGIISDKKEFLDAVKIAGAETKLKSGTFDFPPDCTAEQIVALMTK